MYLQTPKSGDCVNTPTKNEGHSDNQSWRPRSAENTRSWWTPTQRRWGSHQGRGHSAEPCWYVSEERCVSTTQGCQWVPWSWVFWDHRSCRKSRFQMENRRSGQFFSRVCSFLSWVLCVWWVFCFWLMRKWGGKMEYWVCLKFENLRELFGFSLVEV